MANPLPTNEGLISELATKMYGGILKEGAAAGVTMLTAPELLASKSTFFDACCAFNGNRAGLTRAYGLYKADMRALNEWLVTARSVLSCQLGRRWSAAWAAAGFLGPRTALPDNIERQLALGLALETYLTKNPSREVAAMAVTAEMAGALTTATLSSQRTAVAVKAAMTTNRQTRAVARKELLTLMATLIVNLNRKLAPNDPRWLAFGLRMPADPRTPAPPENVSASLATNGSIIVRCERPELATRFRCHMLIVGKETRYRLVFSSSDPLGLVTGVPLGATVQIAMQAVNETLQSRLSAPVLFTMPPVAAAAAA